MKLLALALVTLATSLQAQTAQADLYAMESTTVTAELTSKIETKTAKAGDPVLARTTRDARISDGSRLPLGTKITGKVTEVRAKSDADKSAHLVLLLDRAILRDGTEAHLHVTLTAMAAPSAAGPPTSLDNASADASLFNSPTPGRGGGTSNTSHTMDSTISGSGKPSGKLGEDPLNTTVAASSDPSKPVANVGENANSAAVVRLRHVPVANLPGVILSSAVASATSGSLDATDRNISLASGTQLTLNVIASQQ